MDKKELEAQYPELVKSLISEGKTEEKTRIAQILNSELAEGRESAAKVFALEMDIKASDALKVLGTIAKKEEPIPQFQSEFAKVMATIPNPQIEPAKDVDTNNAEVVAKRIASY
jgi:hypothetical protein